MDVSDVPAATELVALYVPGDRPDRFEKAWASGADQVIIDLEDAVSAEHKADARKATATFLSVTLPDCEHTLPERQRTHPEPGHPCPVPVDGRGADDAAPRPTIAVRPNGNGTPWQAADLAMLATVSRLDALRLPKVESPSDVDAVLASLGTDHGLRDSLPVITCLIESALGVEQAFAIASHPCVAAIALGEADLRAELGITTDSGLDWIRVRIVVAARAAGLPPPAMAAFTNVSDLNELERSCRAGAALGFAGRTAIHPRQVQVIRRAFAPTEDEIAHAYQVLTAISTGIGVATLPDGRMVDEAMAVDARRVLARGGLDR